MINFIAGVIVGAFLMYFLWIGGPTDKGNNR